MKKVPLTQRKYAIVDDEDYEMIINYPHPWRLEKNHNMEYAVSFHLHNRTTSTIRMHTLILVAPKGKQIHHINRISLDNRRANLKAVTQRRHRRGWKIEYHIFNRKIVLTIT